MFQHYAAFKHMNVRDNVAFGLKIRKRPKAEIDDKVDNLLETVGLSGFQRRYPGQLSGGQRQRMALARALAVDPQVLLLDEPFGALDAKVREDLRAWLRRLHDEVHVTTVLVTHDQSEALDVSDRIAVLNKGRIEQVGSPTDVYDQPANGFVMSFLGTVSVPERNPGAAARHSGGPQPGDGGGHQRRHRREHRGGARDHRPDRLPRVRGAGRAHRPPPTVHRSPRRSPEATPRRWR